MTDDVCKWQISADEKEFVHQINKHAFFLCTGFLKEQEKGRLIFFFFLFKKEQS